MKKGFDKRADPNNRGFYALDIQKAMLKSDNIASKMKNFILIRLRIAY